MIVKENDRNQKRHRTIRILRLVTAILLCVCLTGVTVEAKTAPKKKKKSTAPVKLLVSDSSRTCDCCAIINALVRNGAKVTFSSSTKVSAKAYDGLVLPGGADVHPSFYKQGFHGAYGTNRQKDVIQLAAIKAFVKAKKPILGVCRGEQLLNVYFGGTLIQHINGHRGYFKDISIRKDSFAAEAIGKSSARVFHCHHQCVGKLGKGLVVTQTTGSGKYKIVEGFEHKTLPVYGVQWHPELGGTSAGTKVIKKFFSVCRSCRK